MWIMASSSKSMGFNIDDLINEIQNEYRSLKEKLYPDPKLLSKFQNEYYTKSNLKAAVFRHLGDVEYKQSKYHRALGFYTRSAALAMESSEELALAFAGRSAVLFSLGQYEQCVSDINRVLGGEYPKNQFHKLRDRKKKCLVQIKVAGDENRNSPMSHKHVPDSCEIFKNSLLPSASSKIKISYDRKWGRHLLAIEDIEPGEILSRQEFFSAILNLYRYYTHCSYCFTRCDALIPCPSCSMVMYCGENCRNLALQAYHRIECKMWPFYEIEISNDQNILLAMRTLYVGTEQGAQLEHLTKSLDIHRDIFKEKVDISNEPFKSDYLSMLRLRLTFEKPSKKSILLAVKTVIVLQHSSSFFKSDANSDVASQTELFATLALLNHITTTKLYCHKIPEVTLSGHGSIIGTCTEPLHSLINHSCDPNVADMSSSRRKQILFSLRPIKRGEQIFMSYCPPFAVLELTRRKQELSLYGFTCNCVACKKNWPQLDALLNRGTQLVTNCEEMKNTIESMIFGKKHMSIPEIGKEIEDFSEAIKYCKFIHDNVLPPCISLFWSKLYVVRCVFWIWGMKYRTDFRESDNISSRTRDVHAVPSTSTS